MKSWPATRAALIALAMTVALIDGCPTPAPQLTPDALRGVVRSMLHAQRVVLRPFSPIGEGLNLYQRWKLFPVAERERYRMWIEARTGDDAPWQVLYRSHDDEHHLLGAQIEYRRLRGVWNPGSHGPRGGYQAFVAWIGGRLLRDRPELAAVRVRMERIHLREHGEGFDGLGVFAYQQVVTRAEPAR